jgi:hypothetical protein
MVWFLLETGWGTSGKYAKEVRGMHLKTDPFLFLVPEQFFVFFHTV